MHYPKLLTGVININKYIYSIIAVALILLGLTTDAHAEEGPPISIQPLYPDNQAKDVKGYFDLTTQENIHMQDLQVLVTNLTNEVQTIRAVPLNATFSSRGAFEYNEERPTTGQKITNPEYDMLKYLTIENQFYEIPPNEEITLTYKFKKDNMGKDFKGQLMGGLGVYLATPADDADTSYGVESVTRFVIGLYVTFGEKEATKVSFGSIGKVQPQTAYYDILVPLHNSAGSATDNTELMYEVYKGEELLYKSEKPQVYHLSPYTETDIAIPWMGDKLEPKVDYVIRGTLTYNDAKTGEQVKQPFTTKFTYEGNEEFAFEGQDIGGTEVAEEVNLTNLYIALSVLGGLVLVSLLIIVLKKRKKTMYVYFDNINNSKLDKLNINDEEHQQIINSLVKYNPNKDYSDLIPEGESTYAAHIYTINKKGKYTTYNHFNTNVLFKKQ